MDSTPEDASAEPPGHSPLEEQVQVSQEILEQVLIMLGESWTEIELLRQRIHELEQPQPAVALAPGPEVVTERPDPSGVLIVDDSKILQLRIRSVVESLGYQVIGIAEDGAVGLEMAFTRNPHLIILDYNMPVMNGLECLRAIRTRLSDVRVIVCAAEITNQMSHALIRAGVDAMLTKPIQLDRFVQAVRKCMGDGEPSASDAAEMWDEDLGEGGAAWLGENGDDLPFEQ